MNRKTLFGLIAAAVIALIAAIAIQHSRRPATETASETKYLLPELRGHVNDVSRIILTGADDKVIATFERGKDGWAFAEKGGYAVDDGKLREFVLKLSEATLLEQKTANKDRYVTLGVADISAKDASGVQVEFVGLTKPVKLIIGTYNGAGGGGTFVRRPEDAQSWLANGTLTVEKNGGEWLKRDLLDLPSSRIAEATLTRGDGKSLRVFKDKAEDANFHLADIPKGREMSSEFVADPVASTLAGLRIDDVVPAKDAPPIDSAIKAHYRTFDGVVVDVTAWEKDDKHYAQFAASLDSEQADRHIGEQQTGEKSAYEASVAKAAEEAKAKASDDKSAKPAATPEIPKPLAITDPAKDHSDKLAALNKEVADLNAKFSGWTFVLPAYKYTNINKTMDEMLKTPEAKPAADSADKAVPKTKPKAVPPKS
ncbi:MAG: DUF4340 domain-containing protein [Dokdonella sp.]